MTLDELERQAKEAVGCGQMLNLELPRPWRGRPKGFPRGELLCELPGSGMYRIEPAKLVAWLAKNNLAGEQS